MIEKTVLTAEESTQKRPKLSLETINGILNQSRDANDRLTKGIAVYEMIMMAESQDVSDQTTEYEEILNEELDEYIDGLSSEVDEIKYFETPSQRIQRYEKYEESEDLTERKVSKIYLPQSICDDLPSYGLNNFIEEVVHEYYSNPYNDRTDRIECKKELIDYLENETEPSHRVAEAIVSGNSDEFDVSEVHSMVMKDQGGVWWSDYSPSHMSKEATDTKQTPQTRSQYLADYLQTFRDEWGTEPEVYPDDEEELIDLAQEMFGVSARATAEGYVDRIDLDEYLSPTEDEVEEEVNEWLEEEAEDVLSGIKDYIRGGGKPLVLGDEKIIAYADQIPEIEIIEKSRGNDEAKWVGDDDTEPAEIVERLKGGDI